MSCELVISSNAEEYEITVTGGTTCDEIEVTVEIGGEAVPTETDPIFLVSPAGGITSGDIADWNVAYGWGDHSLNHYDATGTVASHLTAFNHGLIQVYETSGGVAGHLVAFNHANIHAAHSDDETASTIGTMLGSQSAATPGASDKFPFTQAVGNTLKTITLSNLTTIINSAGIDLTSYLTTGDNISELVNDANYITSGELPDYTGDFETSGEMSSHLTAFDHSLIDIYETSGEMSGHLNNWDHSQIHASGAVNISTSTDTNITGLLAGDGSHVKQGVPGIDYMPAYNLFDATQWITGTLYHIGDITFSNDSNEIRTYCYCISEHTSSGSDPFNNIDLSKWKLLTQLNQQNPGAITGIVKSDGSANFSAAAAGDMPESASYRTVTDTEKGTWNGKQAALTFGIADTNKVQIDSADVADNEYARFTASGLEGRTPAEVMSDIGAATESFAIAMAVALG
jgi:hypothetical protein